MKHILTSPEIDGYATAMTTPELPVLAALNKETYAGVARPNMLSGHLQGALLQMLSHIARPKQILEIGTYTGYSAICLAQGLQPGGKLHTIDIDTALMPLVARYWQEAGLTGTIIQHTGKGTDIIPTLDGPFDLVFIDADKRGYSNYFDMVMDKVATNGIIIADNTLQSGDVLLPENEQQKNTIAINAFNHKIKDDPRVEKVLLPIRDGITIIRKL